MIRWFAATAALVASVASATAGYTVSTVLSLAPADPGAYPTYNTNALNALSVGATSAGAAGPGQYKQLFTPPLAAQANVAVGTTPTNIWNGTVGAAAITAQYGAAFAGQIGNRVNYGVIATATGGMTFTPSQVTFTSTSSPHFQTAFPNGQYDGNLGALVGLPTLLGRDTTGALVSVTSASQTLTALYYSGPGFGFTANNPLDYDGSQAQFDALNSAPDSMGSIVGIYSLLGSSSQASTDFNAAPAPASVVLMGLGMAGAGLVTRLRRRLAV